MATSPFANWTPPRVEPVPLPVVTFIFPAFGGEKTGEIDIPWHRGMMLRGYLRHPELHPYHLRAKVETHKFYNAKRQVVKQYYSPEPGDTIVLIPAR